MTTGTKSRFAAVYTIKGKVLTPNKVPSPLNLLVDEFNKIRGGRPLSPHLVWRLVATLAK